MSVIKGFIYKYKKGITFICLIIISLSLIFLSHKPPIKNIKKIGFTILYPFQFTFYSVGNFFQNTVNSISQLKKLKEELDNTQNELNQYKQLLIDFNELNNENINLRKLLEFKQQVVFDSVACEVIGMDPKRLFDVIIINKGKNDGVLENMPVISYGGGKKLLIGKVVETTPFASKVVTLQDPKLAVGVIIAKNRIHALLQGNNKSLGIVKLLYLPKDFIISNSDVDFLYTSGDSFIFPGGIEVGKIIKIYPSKRYENFNEADVQISADLSKLEYVLVLKVDYKKNDFNIDGLQN